VCQNAADISPRNGQRAVAPFTVSFLIHACPLEPLRLIRVAGADRVAFLQGQLTQDLRGLGDGDCLRYGWTNAQGRVLATGLVFAWQDSLWLTVSASTADAVLKRLRLFVLRARVALEAVPTAPTGAFTGPAPLALGDDELAASAGARLVGADWIALRVPGDDSRALLAATGGREPPLAVPFAGNALEWSLADIRAGLASVEATTADQYIPQMLNLDLVAGVSFGKGCYTGQEVITRTRHLGRVKRRMFRLLSNQPLDIGAAILGEAAEIGRVVAAAPAGGGHEVLAVLPIESATGPLWGDAGRTITLTPGSLPYAIPPA
jgi:folate-binding protein YgfZ